MDDLLCQEGLSKKTNVELVEIIIKLLRLLVFIMLINSTGTLVEWGQNKMEFDEKTRRIEIEVENIFGAKRTIKGRLVEMDGDTMHIKTDDGKWEAIGYDG